MNRRYTALTMTAFAMGAVVLTTTEASAMLKDPGGGAMTTSASTYDWPDEGSGYPESANRSLEYDDPAAKVPPLPPMQAAAGTSSNGTGFEGMRMGASALGGAGVAFGGMWLYRRRNAQAG